MSGIQYPNETAAYRKARNDLLRAETELREQIERVAEQRRALPPGGDLKENYVFDERVRGEVRPVKFSELFAPGKDTLYIYSFMYGPDMDGACPSCTAVIDALDAQVVHLESRINVAVVAKNPPDMIEAHAKLRGWSHVRLLSSANNTYNVDYFGEVDGRQMTIANVFVRDGGKIRHTWGSEMVFSPRPKGHPRHVDLMWPMWNILDTTPGGRGEWMAALSYDE